MWRAITRLVKRVVLAVIALVVLVGGATYVLGPHAEVAGAYATWLKAQDARDGATVARLSSTNDLAFFDVQRKHAVSSPRDVVAALPFRQRAAVLSFRSQVLNGIIPASVLSDPDIKAAFAEHVNRQPPRSSPMPTRIQFAVPTGTASARGYLDPSPESGPGILRAMIVLAWGMYYDFEETADGWQIDMTPALEVSASENEHWAVRMEPTGNAYIYQAIGATDAVTQERLWEPLDKQGQ
jgi:hypothetical protein